MHYADSDLQRRHMLILHLTKSCVTTCLCAVNIIVNNLTHTAVWPHTDETLYYTMDMGNLLCVSHVINLNNRGTFLKITSCIMKSDSFSWCMPQDSDCCYSNLSWARVHIFSFGSVCCNCYQILCSSVSQTRNPTPNSTVSSITQLAS